MSLQESELEIQVEVVEEPPLLDPGETIARILVAAGHLTENQLVYARRVRSKLATHRTLFNVLRDLDFVTAARLQEALSSDPGAIRLGDLLVELGYLQRSQLDAALNIQNGDTIRRRIGEILVENRFIDDFKLADVIAIQCGIQRLELQPSDIEKSLISKPILRSCIENSFVPVRRQGTRILVAFSDPTDLKARSSAERLFGQDLIMVVATRQAVQDALISCERGTNAAAASANDSAVVRTVDEILAAAFREGASDVHIEPGIDRLRVRFRCDGVMVPYKDFRKDIGPALASRIKILAKADIAEKRRHQDGRLLFEDPQTGTAIDMRVSFYVSIHGENVVLRLLTRKSNLLDLNDIGMAPRMLDRFRDDALDVPSGVVMITGPTGSGKTTTLYSCVNYLNDSQTSIITAEDPVEYVVEGVAQCSINQKLNVTFEDTLRHIVRQDPDVIVLGEIRDRFSADTAIQAALTGHKVITTFHTEDSIGGLLRLLNMDIEAFLISSTVVCVVAQRLLRRVCEKCPVPYTPTPLDLRRLGYGSDSLVGVNFNTGTGCSNCRFTGYRGRVSAFELLILNEMVKDALLNRKTSYEIRRISLETSGLVTLIEDGLVKAARGDTSLQEVLRHLPRLHPPRPIQELRRLTGAC